MNVDLFFGKPFHPIRDPERTTWEEHRPQHLGADRNRLRPENHHADGPTVKRQEDIHGDEERGASGPGG